MVEAQHRVSTMKLTDTIADQELLEQLLDGTKPPVPPECQHLHYLLYTPFRYGPYLQGSRFRRAGPSKGVFYAAESPETAIAETCFYRLLFFHESPDTKWPSDAGEYTAFACEYAAGSTIDLTRDPFDDRQAVWMHPLDHEPCQQLADLARAEHIDAILYASVRDPLHRKNVAIMTCRAFASAGPTARQTWRILVGSNGARAICDLPKMALDYDRTAFASDPRIAALRWDR
ncbi:MAG: RES family NAD+ phosphorylase [Pseudomonadota bacterium]